MYPLSNQIPSPPISHHLIVEELDLRHHSQGGCLGESCVSKLFQNGRAPCPTAPTHARCRPPTQCAHQVASHEPFDERSARMSWCRATTLALTCRGDPRTFFFFSKKKVGEKCEKPLKRLIRVINTGWRVRRRR